METSNGELPCISMMCEQLLHLVETTAEDVDVDVTCFGEMFPA
jgi:hypothetical protein